MLCDGLKIDDISSSQRLLATPAFSVCRIFNSLMYSGLFSINRFTSRTKKGKTKHDVLFGLCVVFFPEKIPGTIYIYILLPSLGRFPAGVVLGPEASPKRG